MALEASEAFIPQEKEEGRKQNVYRKKEGGGDIYDQLRKSVQRAFTSQVSNHGIWDHKGAEPLY